MAILKIKKLLEDLELGTTQVLPSVGMTVTKATSAGNAGTTYKATSAGNSGSAAFATTSGNAGTSRVAHFASSGTAALAGTHAIFATGL